MVHNTAWWCTTQSCTHEVVHNVALTNPCIHPCSKHSSKKITNVKLSFLGRTRAVCLQGRGYFLGGGGLVALHREDSPLLIKMIV